MAVRWLSVKRWLSHKDHKLQLVPDAPSKRCWACLRGGVLELYHDEKSCENRSLQHSRIGQLAMLTAAMSLIFMSS